MPDEQGEQWQVFGGKRAVKETGAADEDIRGPGRRVSTRPTTPALPGLAESVGVNGAAVAGAGVGEGIGHLGEVTGDGAEVFGVDAGFAPDDVEAAEDG